MRCFKKRTDGISRKNSKDEREREIQSRIKNDAVRETEVLGWVRE